MTEFADLPQRLENVRARIESAGGDPDRIRIVAVTKGFGAEAVNAALSAGLTDIGENYAQELRSKASEVGGKPRWHFIGKLQTNKVRQLAPLVHVWQSVDRRELLDELAKRAPSASVLIEVNLSGEPDRGGCAWESAPGLVTAASELGLEVRGLMGVGEMGDPEDSRAAFRRLSEMASHMGLHDVSMGMSADMEVAVQEGSTMLRLGSALFGSRPLRSTHSD